MRGRMCAEGDGGDDECEGVHDGGGECEGEGVSGGEDGSKEDGLGSEG